ncbi:oxysterol-binding protein domain-containing protein [Phthorimaea operculella]|nr:oxysterol-binding protein domain-containing protein [Phthorimaea operculella]
MSAKKKPRKISKWAQFVESIELLAKDQEMSSDSSDNVKKDHSFFDFLIKKETFDRNAPSTSSMRVASEPKMKQVSSKSVTSSPMRLDSITKKAPLLRCFEVPKLTLPIGDKKAKEKDISPFEENIFRFVNALPKRRSSTPQSFKVASKRISQLRSSGAKTDSENDDLHVLKDKMPQKPSTLANSEVICTSPDNIVITKTAPSVERVRRYSSSSTDEVCADHDRRFLYSMNMDKYSLINSSKLPSQSLEAVKTERREDRFSSQNVYVAGKIVRKSELAGAASDSDSETGMADPLNGPPKGVREARQRIESFYTEDPNRDVGVAGEVVEEIAEENKSLLWFLMKQVRPGMDLSKVVLPTFILEPRSFLDKLSDNYYHADILANVSALQDPYDRFKTVLKWYMSGLYRKPRGLKKPYNPVLGETFRCCWKQEHHQNYTYYVSEQVSHHPPISAFYVSNRKDGYVVEGSLLAKSKFYGNSTSAILEGCARVYVLPWGEVYTTTAPYAHCKGIVMGTLSMELGGKVHIICEKTGYHADVEFKLRSFLGSAEQTNSVSGRIKYGGETVAVLDGYWDGRITLKDKKTGEEAILMDVPLLKEQRMPRYLVKLENQHDYESQKLWIKVSEAIAKEDQVVATEQKTLIEEAQRVRCKNQVTPWVPRFFHRDDHPEAPSGVVDQGWRYNHSNYTQWQPEEQFEYEEDFVIQTITSTGAQPRLSSTQRAGSIPHVSSVPRVPALGPLSPTLTDSDTHEDVARRSKTSSLLAIASTPRTGSIPHVSSVPRVPALGPLSPTLTDSDTHEDVARRSKTSSRTLKQSLLQIDAAMREQTIAIEQLTKKVQALSEGQRQAQYRPQSARVVNTSHTWDMFGGFVLAVILQALLNWIFHTKD